MNAVIYARYSSSSQREASIEEQVKVCKNYAERKGYNIVEIYKDLALTGRNDNRPNFQKLLSDSSKGLFKYVLVYSIDRFGRDLLQNLLNEARLSENNVDIESATEHFSKDSFGRFTKYLQMANAQYYSEELSDKINRGLKHNAENGIYNGGGVPLGYQINKEQQFEINLETAPIVQSIYEMYASGKTVAEIIRELNAQGYKTSMGNSFNQNSLHTILKNKRYLGYYIYRDYEIPNAIPQIIDNNLFNKVQAIMNRNRKAPASSKAKVQYLLTTKLFCGCCKEMMTGYSARGKQGKVYHYYICNGRKKKSCDKKLVDKDYIENLVVNECRRLLTKANINRIVKEVIKICNQEKNTEILKRLKKQLTDNERKQQNTINAITESEISSVRKALGEKIQVLENQHKELEKKIENEEASMPILSEESMLFFLTKLKKGNVNDFKYRKMLVNVFVNKIFLYDDRFTITFNTDDKAVTITDKLLSQIQEDRERARVLFLDDSGPPK
ncbi:MAG: recombinase family protein [Eubacterium sp.]